MDIKIKKIYQFGTYNDENGWANDGETVVVYEDESKAPLHVSGDETYKAFDEYALELGIDTEANPRDIAKAIEKSAEVGLLNFYDKNNAKEMNAALVEIAEAEQKANAANLGRKEVPPVVVPPITTDPVPPNNNEDELDIPEEELGEEELTAPEAVVVEDEKGNTLKKVLAGAGVALTLGGLAASVTSCNQKAETTKDLENENQQGLDYNTASFEELMNSMSEEDPRRQTAEAAMSLVTSFHEATHKEGNFRLEADGSNYLDLSYEEGLVLALFANNGSTEEMYSVLGDYNLTEEHAQDLLESARNKLITYYMNAKEASGLANVFTNPQDKAFFEKFENSILSFNAQHAKEIETELNKDATMEDVQKAKVDAKKASDDVIRNVYYNYLLDGAASLNATEISPLAKLLAFDTVYAGLNLTESASAEHTYHLQFEGLGAEKETEWYVTNVLGLDYSTLSDVDKESYRGNIIESGMQLVKINQNGSVMNEENATENELNSASVSITNLIDQMGLCNQANQDISSRMAKLGELSQQRDLQMTIMNQAIARDLRSIGSSQLDAIASQIESTASNAISADLLQVIRDASTDSANIVKGYEQSASFIVRAGIPGIDVIIEAANEETKAQNYSEGIGMVATLINNRRHTPTQKEHGPDENGYMGEDENGVPTYSDDSYDKVEDKDAFIKENGAVIEEVVIPTPNAPKEEVQYDDLTESEKEKVEVQINEAETQIAKDNAEENGKKSANKYSNSTDRYDFGVDSVTNPYNKEVHDLSGKSFFDTINYLVAFGDSKGVPGEAKEDEQITKAAEVAALQYVESLTNEEKTNIATAMGVSWTEAKNVLIESFKTGYFDQMNNEIEKAIEAGQEHKISAEKAAQEALQGVQPNQQQVEVTPVVSVPNQPVDTTPVETVPEQPVATIPNIVAPEQPVQNVPAEPVPIEPVVTVPTVTDEFDPNVDIVFGEGEVSVGNNVVLNPQPNQNNGMDAMFGNLTDEQIDAILGVSVTPEPAVTKTR